MADGYIQVPPDSTGKLIDTSEIVVSTRTVERHRINIADPVTASALAPVTSSGGLGVTILAGAASGSTAVNIVGSSGAIAPATSSGGLSVTIVAGAASGSTVVSLSSAIAISSGTITLSSNPTVAVSSGIITLSSVHTVTATAATNPWSSAPSFNIPVVNASSGVTQTLDSTSQVYLTFMTITSSAGNLSTTIQGTPSILKGYSIFNSNAAARFFKFFNTTSAPTLGTATPFITLLIPGSTAGAGAVQTLEKGVNFTAGLSIAITDAMATTSTGAVSANDVAANIYYT